jgi:tRNA threonylcarbamoyladenosine biosynthesis protein TsaE
MTLLDQLRIGITTASAAETRRLAARLAAALPSDATLALHGDLGVGKTTFVQGLAAGFGLPGPVTSPTFNILHLYRGTRVEYRSEEPEPRCHDLGEAGFTLVHLDAYRLENAHQVAELMIDDFLVSPYCLAVEWPDKIAAWLPAGTLHLTLGIEAPGRHRITLA